VKPRARRLTEEEKRIAEGIWPRDVPDEQHIAAFMANGLSAAEARMTLDLVRGDMDMDQFRRQLFWRLLLGRLWPWK
jgi:hypothetical protein